MRQLKAFSGRLVLVVVLACLSLPRLQAQRRHELFLGTQFPVQLSAGYQYNASDYYSIRGQFGFLTPPYDKFIIKSMELFGFDKKLSKALDESFRSGIVGTLAPQLRIGNNFLMLQGQYVHLNGSITLQRAAELYLDRDLPDLGGIPFLPALMPELTTRSNLFMLGVGYGRRFPLSNAPVSIQIEAGFSKILGSVNNFSSNLGRIDDISLIQSYYSQMDDRLKKSYRQYGYVPSVSVYLVYHLGGAQ